jgi:transposase
MANPNIDVWAIDEVHFQQHGSRCRMWIAPEEKDPVLMQEPTRRKVGYFGAVRIRDGKFVYKQEINKFNGESFLDFLKQLRKASCQAGKKVIILSDNARYHHATLHKEYREKCSDKFAFEFLAPYSPDLNPIERIWKLTRRCCTHNRYFESIESITAVIEAKFIEWNKGNETLRKLCAIY